MKLVSRLAVVLFVCLMAVPSLALPAAAQDSTPYITRSPSTGVPGDTITVTGGNFTADEWVDIYYYLNGTARIRVAEARSTSAGSFTVTFEVPDSYRGTHKIRAEDTGVFYADADFSVRSGLTASPEEGHVDDSVTVTGQGYGQNETGIELRYFINGTYEVVATNIAADADGSWQRDFRIPLSIKGSHAIDTQPAPYRRATFTVAPGIRADRSSGSPGESITVTGGGFRPNDRRIRILFAGQAVAEGIWSDGRGAWQGSFEVPELPKGTYIVTAEGDFTEKEDVAEVIFAVRPGIVLSPGEGHVGMNVTAYGGGFGVNEDVIVLYEDIEVATATTDENGSFEVIFAVPQSRHGSRQVTGEDGTGNTTDQPAIFTMESDPPPTPELISPEDGDRIGFASKVRPRFEWSEVEDDSGVHYDLQISASANLTADCDFIDPLLTMEGLVGANLTLARADALPHGTYYWIVRAVDGAENAGNWTAVYSFRAGRLPLWAFIVIIVFAALGAGAGIYFYLIRRRRYW